MTNKPKKGRGMIKTFIAQPRKPRTNLIIASCVALLVLIAGVIIIRSSASGVVVTSEPEAGSVVANAFILDDSNASGGKAVKFSSLIGPEPLPAGMPTPDTTGWKHTGKTLTPVQGKMYIDTPGVTIEEKDIRDGIVIVADNVTIRNSRVTCETKGCPGIWIDWNVQNTLIEDVEITSVKPDVRVDRAITAGKTYNTIMRRLYVHDVQRGVEYGYTATLEDSYIGDLNNPTPAHVSGVGGETGSDTVGNSIVTINHNVIDATPGQGNSGAFLYYLPDGYSSFPPQKIKFVITNNIFSGGNYCMDLSAHPLLSGTLDVKDNYFSMKHWENCAGYGTHSTGGSEGNLLPKRDGHPEDPPKVGNVVFTWSNNKWWAPTQAKHGQQVPIEARQ